ncbi:MAG: hypothetical protein JKY10_03915 [Cohaesibacteraceae bacterium]|nr:hypothetical protein [Cohaesibacteraceae bacterium]
MEILKGERKRVLRRFSNSMQMTYHFTVNPINSSDLLTGQVEVSGSNWIFPNNLFFRISKKKTASPRECGIRFTASM